MNSEFEIEPLDDEGRTFQSKLNSLFAANQFEAALKEIYNRREEFQFTFTLTPSQATLSQPNNTFVIGRAAPAPVGLPVGPGLNVTIPQNYANQKSIYVGSNSAQKPLGGMIVVGKQGVKPLNIIQGAVINQGALGGGIKNQLNQYRPY
ncbi:hypothetical protein SteCoe_10337 [Stentor coeruleus]|uniref:Uncharacterized protein n=1 Tax=Stentor coeruleus TaxID=5963 RepID=A0A1R2CFR6_9CILI|nr:hypothetical protein SteCoe_10337 [Stentor coeruleus]